MEYFARNCHVGASLGSAHDARYIRPLGVDRVMWGHAAPHPEGSDGRTTESLRAIFHHFTPEECRRMLTSTAADLYRFDVHALTPIAGRIGPRIEEVARPLGELPDDSTGAAFWRPNDLRVALDEGAALAVSVQHEDAARTPRIVSNHAPPRKNASSPRLPRGTGAEDRARRSAIRRSTMRP